jgi:hypothetical protein
MRPRQLLRRGAIVYDSTVPRARPITDRELTLALLHRQFLLARQRCSAAAAVRRLVALQAQYSLSPYLALHARVDGFAVGDLERALKRGTVVKATLMRGTLHLVHAADYPAFASAWRFQARRMLRGREPGLADEDERIVAALAAFLRQPRTTDEIRAHTRALAGERIRHPSAALDYARLSLPLVHRMPSGLWRQHGKFSLVAWDGPPVAADPAPGTAALVRAYLGAFGPATREDIAAFTWLRFHQLDPAIAALEPLRRFTDRRGRELLDLPRAPLAGEQVAPPVRFLPKWDAALISHRDRSHLLPPAFAEPLLGARNGEVPRTYLVDGTVAGTWTDGCDGDVATLTLASLIGTSGDAVPSDLEAEGERLLGLLHPQARTRRVEIASA